MTKTTRIQVIHDVLQVLSHPRFDGGRLTRSVTIDRAKNEAVLSIVISGPTTKDEEPK